jgi:hypothetical protein
VGNDSDVPEKVEIVLPGLSGCFSGCVGHDFGSRRVRASERS